MSAPQPSAPVARGSHVRLRVLPDDGAELGEDALPTRPRTRAECTNVPRPCPWVGCRHHLFLEVDARGAIVVGAHAEPEDMSPERSCSLDLADDGGLGLEEVGELLAPVVTGARVLQIVHVALRRLARLRGLRELMPVHDPRLPDP